MQKWEYLVATVRNGIYWGQDEHGEYSFGTHPELQAALNKAGEDGWELIQAAPEMDSFVFKRPKP